MDSILKIPIILSSTLNSLQQAQLIDRIVFSFVGSVMLTALIAITWYFIKESRSNHDNR